MTDVESGRTITCPGCGESTSIEIRAHSREPWTRTSESLSATWDARCAGCGTGWSFVDRV